MIRFIIVHMEKRLYKWAFLEYKHIGELISRDLVLFTNLTKTMAKTLSPIGKTTTETIERLPLNRPCLLDPHAEKTLAPEESKQFSDFIFGGILGDYPPQKRTQELVTLLPHVPRRNLGKEQMSTDTAIFVTKKICDGIPLEKLVFHDEYTIPMGEGMEMNLPYRYLVDDGKIIFSDKLLAYLKKKKGF
ncbi:hypothetical protein HY639_02220 [Candidatus Woesearchaeota archaeon]|nr:hypothetical protein [Candidatus Woesearchaeota archaeon]